MKIKEFLIAPYGYAHLVLSADFHLLGILIPKGTPLTKLFPDGMLIGLGANDEVVSIERAVVERTEYHEIAEVKLDAPP